MNKLGDSPCIKNKNKTLEGNLSYTFIYNLFRCTQYKFVYVNIIQYSVREHEKYSFLFIIFVSKLLYLNVFNIDQLHIRTCPFQAKVSQKTHSF